MMQFQTPLGATLLNPDEIDGLKLKHITTRAELDRWEQDNIQDAIGWLESRQNAEILNEKFITLLHKKMFGRVWKWAGNFRRSNKNIGVEWIHIPVELRHLLNDVNYWIENKVYSHDEIAYRLHHKLVWIHLFPNGNGRHSRLMADVLMSDVFGLEPFTWGTVNLTEDGMTRKRYIDALMAADEQDYNLLEAFVRS